MAKVQKTIMVPEELHRLACEFEIRTGANFTRIVTAALIEYLVAGLPPRHDWMIYAVALERGEKTLADILLEIHDRAVERAEVTVTRAQQLDLREGTPNPFLEDAQRALSLYSLHKQQVQELLQNDQSIDSFIACWVEIAGTYAKHAVPRDLNR